MSENSIRLRDLAPDFSTTDAEKHELPETLISEIHVYPDQKPSGQWIESIGFRLPILENSFEMSLDKLGGLGTVMLFFKPD